MTTPEGPTGPIDRERQCFHCGREVDADGEQAITLVVGRSELLDRGEERLFRREQVLLFCDLAHANAHLARHPLQDEWPDSEVVDLDDESFLGVIGCLLLAVALLVVLGVGATVSAAWLWDAVA
ncbi:MULTISPECIES: hypothetical protein [unclassified Aeromicrobium]|uniref:hypothetical protein n=1 Tax=unclassified Aeromicrobium TaxID=2633570 RepID=UPI00288B7DC4|nr:MULTISPECIES: hypothetical protein [unclassified Aeromicrobium]